MPPITSAINYLVRVQGVTVCLKNFMDGEDKQIKELIEVKDLIAGEENQGGKHEAREIGYRDRFVDIASRIIDSKKDEIGSNSVLLLKDALKDIGEFEPDIKKRRRVVVKGGSQSGEMLII